MTGRAYASGSKPIGAMRPPPPGPATGAQMEPCSVAEVMAALGRLANDAVARGANLLADDLYRARAFVAGIGCAHQLVTADELDDAVRAP